jgi:hypothetical protein
MSLTLSTEPTMAMSFAFSIKLLMKIMHTKTPKEGVDGLKDLGHLLLDLRELADVCLVLDLEFLAVIIVDLLDILLSLVQGFMQLTEEVSEVSDLLLSEDFNLLNLLLAFTLYHFILVASRLHSELEGLQVLLNLERSRFVREDEVMLGMVHDTLRAQRLPVLPAIVLDLLLRMNLAPHVLLQHQSNLLLRVSDDSPIEDHWLFL